MVRQALNVVNRCSSDFLALVSKLLTSVKSRAQMLMQYHQKENNRDVIDEATAKFQQAMIEDSARTFLPRKPSLDFD